MSAIDWYEVAIDATDAAMGRFLRSVVVTGSEVRGKPMCLAPKMLADGPKRSVSVWMLVGIPPAEFPRFRDMSKATIKPVGEVKLNSGGGR